MAIEVPVAPLMLPHHLDSPPVGPTFHALPSESHSSAQRSIEQEWPPVLHRVAGVVMGAVTVAGHVLPPVDQPRAHAVVCQLGVALEDLVVPELRPAGAGADAVVLNTG